MEAEISDYETLYQNTRTLATALGFRDMMTRMHSERVFGIAGAIGMRCGLDATELSALRISASFHDIGKIGIPDRVLLKPGSLNVDEWEMMQRHSAIGEEIILSAEITGSELAARAIRHHHEHFGGGGYPDGLIGEHIPICSRIIAIADSYDAMAVSRSYHRARKHSEIMAILNEETGQKHDPELMAYFVEIIENSPYRTTDN